MMQGWHRDGLCIHRAVIGERWWINTVALSRGSLCM